MEVEVMLPSPPVDLNFDSASTSPYITAPSSPQRFGNLFYSTPTSHTSVSALYRDFKNYSAAATGRGDTTNDDGADFAFDFSGQLEKSSLTADELFDGGKIKPLKPPPLLQYENKPPDPPKSAQSPKKFTPRHRKEEFDPFAVAINQTQKENIQESSRRTKSLCPFRVSDLLFDADYNQRESKNSSAVPSSSNSSIFSATSWYKKWKIKDLLLFRSASESRATELKKNCHQDGDQVIKSCSFRSTDSVGSGSSRRTTGPSISAHELHYTPLKPPPRLQYENKPPDPPKSAQSPKKFSPRHRKEEFDPFAAAINQTQKENIQESSRRTKSLSPFRVSDLLFDADNNQRESKNSSAVPSSSNSSIFSATSWYKRWKIKDLLLFRSASESRATELKKNCHQDGDQVIKSCSFRSTDSVGSGSSRTTGPSISAHELHYTVNRAVSEEMKKRTFLPYKQGLLGCLGFNPSASSSR
ncbi:unnamed protein product [Fraxinus pennsylvanica]|uniref:Calmodulin-binding protein n=1 Tax=Fraxinus pennsylvanica TaxID=56036 RepID=A0AAD2ADJ6_9LAMI|nr:unnamed protein product [Fraxinus pennsylvanica]